MTLDLVTLGSHEAVRHEVQSLFCLTWPHGEGAFLDGAFADVVRLYNGQWPDYYPCDTPYHDMTHAMTVTLAMARLLHGAVVDGHEIREAEGMLCLVAALFHDAGLIRHRSDPEVRGAELTDRHVARGMAILKGYLEERGWDADQRQFACSLLACTEFLTDVSGIYFYSERQRYLGTLLKAADLAGQMADMRYGQKLLLLAAELRDAEKERFVGERMLLKNSPDFCRKVLEGMVDGSGKSVLDHFETHFRVYRGMAINVYLDQIHRQIAFLEAVVAKGGDAYRETLAKGGVKMGCPVRDFDAIYPKH